MKEKIMDKEIVKSLIDELSNMYDAEKNCKDKIECYNKILIGIRGNVKDLKSRIKEELESKN